VGCCAIIGMAIVSVRSRVVHLFIGILGQRLYSENTGNVRKMRSRAP
jgi:hypothetical protein